MSQKISEQTLAVKCTPKRQNWSKGGQEAGTAPCCAAVWLTVLGTMATKAKQNKTKIKKNSCKPANTWHSFKKGRNILPNTSF